MQRVAIRQSSTLGADAYAAHEMRGALKQHGMRITPQRQLMLEVVAGMRGQVAADDIHQLIAARFPDIHITTVYRTLEVLEELGLVRHTHFHSHAARYQRTDEQRHQYLVCLACGNHRQIDEDILQPLADHLRREFEFEPDLTHTAIVGVCQACSVR